MHHVNLRLVLKFKNVRGSITITKETLTKKKKFATNFIMLNRKERAKKDLTSIRFLTTEISTVTNNS